MPTVRDTISDTLAILRLNVENALNDLQTVPADSALDEVVLGNIAFWDELTSPRTPSPANKIVMTLVKTEEEYALKNQTNHRRNPVSGNLEYVNPPVFLNLTVLFSVNTNDYEKAMTFLSRIIGYFQFQRVFTENNATIPVDVMIEHFQFNVSMLSPSFEELNNLWSMLGGKLIPSVLYKFQLQKLEYIPDELLPASPIREIIVNEQLH